MRSAGLERAIWLCVCLIAIVGCARLRTAPPLPLCEKNVVVVTGPWSASVDTIFRRVYAVAKGDLAGLPVDAVGLRITNGAALTEEGFAVCRGITRATITMPETRVLQVLGRRDAEIDFARAFAHMLAHLALHPKPAPAGELHDLAEAEADELGVFYFERAGFDCTRWEKPGEYRRNIRIACNLAKQGVSLHVPKRTPP